MLIGNYSVLNKCPSKLMSGTSTCDRSAWNQSGMNRNMYCGDAGTVNINTSITDYHIVFYQGLPSGYNNGWMLPQYSGYISSINGVLGQGNLTNGNLAGGLNGVASISGAGSVTNAILSAIGKAIALLTATGSINANISGQLSLAASLAASGSVNATILALGNVATAITASGGITSANGSLLVSAVASIFGLATFTPSVVGEEYMFASIASVGTINASVLGVANASASLQGNANLVVALTAIGNMVEVIISSSTFTITTGATPGNMQAPIVIGAQDPLSPEALAASLWNSIAANYNVANSMGHIMNTIGSGTDPWSTNLPGTYSGIQAGKILADLETIVKQVKALTSANL